VASFSCAWVLSWKNSELKASHTRRKEKMSGNSKKVALRSWILLELSVLQKTSTDRYYAQIYLTLYQALLLAAGFDAIVLLLPRTVLVFTEYPMNRRSQ